MRIYKTFCLILLISAMFSKESFAQEVTKIETTLRGTIMGRPDSKNLLLVKAFDDARHDRNSHDSYRKW